MEQVMSDETASDVKFEIGHVLFVDIVGYSKLLIHEQSACVQKLREIVRATEEFREGEAEGTLMRLPTGDGGALVFRTTPEAPVACALEIARALRNHPDLRVRMGIHSGPVKEVTDLNEQINMAGAGINLAQRVMDYGDAGHILLSERVAQDLEQYARWRPLLHELGTCEIKHGGTLTLINLYSDEIGNPRRPGKLGAEQSGSNKGEASPPASQKSIAVLPFENMSEDKANAYFADGIQEEILTRLSRIAELKVISRTSTLRYKNSPDSIPEIARQLGVATILEGSIRKAGDRVRVNVQLIDALNDSHLWAERYDRQLIDIFAVETDIASKIADTLQAKLTGPEREAISSRPTTSTEAHQLYLKGRYHWRNFYAPGYERVRDYFQKAIENDPTYAPAYNGLSLYYSFGASNAIFSPNECWPKAEEAVRKSLSLDDTLAEAYNALAAVEIYYKRDWPAAERAFRRGAELDRNFGDIPAHHALCLAYFNRKEDALAEMDRALQLDPFFPGINLHYGTILFFFRDYDRAAAQLAKILELYPDYGIAHDYFASVCAQMGLFHEAVTHWRAALRLTGHVEQAEVLEHVFAASGYDAAVRALAGTQLQELEEKTGRDEYVPAWNYLMAYLRLGDTEQAFAWLAKTAEEPNWFALQLKVNPLLDPLRKDPRFDTVTSNIFTKRPAV
jgi:adenylate cyclase